MRLDSPRHALTSDVKSVVEVAAAPAPVGCRSPAKKRVGCWTTLCSPASRASACRTNSCSMPSLHCRLELATCSDAWRSYVKDKIVLITRDKPVPSPDNGVWLATTEEHHQSLRRDFPNMRSIQVLGKKVTGWQVLPADADDFEEAALRACELVLAGDPRIGKIPKGRRTLKTQAKRASKQSGSPKKASKSRPLK